MADDFAGDGRGKHIRGRREQHTYMPHCRGHLLVLPNLINKEISIERDGDPTFSATSMYLSRYHRPKAPLCKVSPLTGRVLEKP